jgi:hypothetical protein
LIRQSGFPNACAATFVVRQVRDYGAFQFQVARKLMRDAKFQTPLKPLFALLRVGRSYLLLKSIYLLVFHLEFISMLPELNLIISISKNNEFTHDFPGIGCVPFLGFN